MELQINRVRISRAWPVTGYILPLQTFDCPCVNLDRTHFLQIQDLLQKEQYRSSTANSNTVNSKFHLIRSLDEDLARFLLFHV